MADPLLGQPISRRAALAGLIGSGLALAACSGSSPAAPAPGVPVPTGPVRDLTSFGAVGDGRTDDTAAIRRALQQLQPGETLQLPAGRDFLHTDVLVVTTRGVRITGPGRFVAGEESRSSLQVMADDVLVDTLELAVPRTTQRFSAPAQHRLFVGDTSGVTVRGVTVRGSAAAGFFLYGAKRFVLDHVVLRGSEADGIHMTNGSSQGMVIAPDVQACGDDGVAVVSYLSDGGGVCHDIAVTHPVVRDQTGGRGISVVGGQNVSYTDIDITGSRAASVYLACEGDPYNTFPTRGARVSGGQIHGANTDTSIDHGAVLIYSGRNGGSVSDVQVSDLKVTDTRQSASRQVGIVVNGTGTFDKILLQGFSVTGGPPSVFATNATVPPGTVKGFTVDGAARQVGP